MGYQGFDGGGVARGAGKPDVVALATRPVDDAIHDPHHLLAGMIVGALMGWQFDVWLGTKPVFLVIMTMFGMAAGFWNVYRLASAPTGSQGGGGKRPD